MLSGFMRKWRGGARSGSHVTVIEWRDEGLLVLRMSTQGRPKSEYRSAQHEGDLMPPLGAAQPAVQEAQFVECKPDKREAGVARLAKQGWFSGGRNILLLGIRQRQMAVLPRPTVPDAELVEAARWQLQGALDYPPEEAVLDVLRIGQDEPPARQQLAVFAVRRSELARWLAPFTARKITLEAVEVADCAQRNLAALHPSKGQPVAMLSLREDSIVFSVTRGSEVLVSRSFDAAGVKAGGADHAAEIAALAERVGLQLQRMLDTLERRSAAMAPSQILVLSHPQPSLLLTQCAELTGLRVLPLDLGAMLEPARRAAPDAPTNAAISGDFLHLLGAALRPAPVGVAV